MIIIITLLSLNVLTLVSCCFLYQYNNNTSTNCHRILRCQPGHEERRNVEKNFIPWEVTCLKPLGAEIESFGMHVNFVGGSGCFWIDDEIICANFVAEANYTFAIVYIIIMSVFFQTRCIQSTPQPYGAIRHQHVPLFVHTTFFFKFLSCESPFHFRDSYFRGRSDVDENDPPCFRGIRKF